jgi:hypothetical protein
MVPCSLSEISLGSGLVPAQERGLLAIHICDIAEKSPEPHFEPFCQLSQNQKLKQQEQVRS